MVELQLLVRGRHASKAVSDAWRSTLGALSVSVEDADAGTGARRPLFGEPGLPSRSRAGAFADQRPLRRRAAAAAAGACCSPSPTAPASR